jgi:hypothetical protein
MMMRKMYGVMVRESQYEAFTEAFGFTKLVCIDGAALVHPLMHCSGRS